MCHNQAILGAADFVLDGNLRELERLVEGTTQFCREHSLSGEAESDLHLVLEELFVNAVRHGGCEGMAKAVEIRLEWMDGRVCMEFGDRGRAFDPSLVPPRDAPSSLAESRSGGLGLHFVHQLAEDIQYRRSGEWNRSTMKLKSV